MNEYTFPSAAANEPTVECMFRELRFHLPTTMAANFRIVRPQPSDVWLAFEDAQRQMQIRLSGADLRMSLPSIPPKLSAKSVPALLRIIGSASTGDFSFALTPDQLTVHDWALASRRSLGLDIQNFDRFAFRDASNADLIMFSMEPTAVDSKRRLRSLLAWEASDRVSRGMMWFGDVTNGHVGWIDAVAMSVDVVSGDRTRAVTDTDFATMTDAEILALIRFSNHAEIEE